MNTPRHRIGLYVQMTAAERRMTDRLRDDHSINISGFVKRSIREYLEKLDELKLKTQDEDHP